MTVTTLDAKTALIIIDLQRGIVGTPTVHPVKDVIDRSTALAETFRRHDLPVVLVNVEGTPVGRTDLGGGARQLPDGFADLIPELNQQPTDHVVTKQARSAFTNTGLTDRLRTLGITQVVITGVATSAGVESTARDAHENGFHVTLAVDAMTDRDAAAHEHSVTRTFPRIAETGTTEQILDLLNRSRG